MCQHNVATEQIGGEFWIVCDLDEGKYKPYHHCIADTSDKGENEDA